MSKVTTSVILSVKVPFFRELVSVTELCGPRPAVRGLIYCFLVKYGELIPRRRKQLLSGIVPSVILSVTEGKSEDSSLLKTGK